MTPAILFRQTDYGDIPEMEAASDVFPFFTQRSAIPRDSLVIPRYSCLPFYNELVKDCENLGSKLINSHSQHLYVANISQWYEDFKDLTPKTWKNLFEAKKSGFSGPYVLKGETNSKKFSWKTHMYAHDWEEAGNVFSRLLEDSLIGTQNIVVREFVPLKKYGIMPSGVPISHEFRCFFYKNKLLAKGYYWSNEDVSPVDDIPPDFLQKIADIGGNKINFWVADVAQTEKGEWIVVELNDGSMSGLSSVNPVELYKNLKEALKEDGYV